MELWFPASYSGRAARPIRPSPQRSSTTMSLPLLPWCGVRADRRPPMPTDSGVVEPFDFRRRRRPTTNFARPRTRSSNPVPSSGESAANLQPGSCIEKSAVAAVCAGPTSAGANDPAVSSFEAFRTPVSVHPSTPPPHGRHPKTLNETGPLRRGWRATRSHFFTGLRKAGVPEE